MNNSTIIYIVTDFGSDASILKQLGKIFLCGFFLLVVFSFCVDTGVRRSMPDDENEERSKI